MVFFIFGRYYQFVVVVVVVVVRSFLGPLAKGNKNFLGDFGFVSVDGPGQETSGVLHPGDMRNTKEIQGTHCYSPQILRQLTFLSDLSKSSCVCLSCYILEDFSCKGEYLAGMGLLHPSGTESNISFSIKNAIYVI